MQGTGSIAKATNSDGEEEAMFAKKYLGGWSCASCEKNLGNMQGHLAEYQNWSKLPFKDPNERLAKVNIYHFILLVWSRFLQDIRDDEAIRLIVLESTIIIIDDELKLRNNS